MTTQEQLGGGIASIDEVLVYYRPVKSGNRLIQPTKQVIDSPSELSDVEDLLEYIKEKKLDYPLPLSSSSMGEFRRDRVIQIFSSEAEMRYVEQFLGLFCESLEGKQRAKNKYAMLIYYGEGYLLAHVKAEKGMSIHEEEGTVELIRRFLDVDNILSAALFEKDSDGYEFSHFTDSGSDSFRDFIGVNEHRLNYRRKTIQILCYYRGLREYECKFEFTNDEVTDKWLRDEEIQLSAQKLRFTQEGPNQAHEIKEIRWGNSSYKSVEKFRSEFKEQSLGLDLEREKYQGLLKYPEESEAHLSLYDEQTSATDHRREVELKGAENREFLNKSETQDNLYVIYAGKHIQMDTGFADDIFHDLVSGKGIRIYHPSEAPAGRALEIGNVEFLNIERGSISSERLTFLKETYDHAINRSGDVVAKCLVISLLTALSKPAPQQLSRAFEQLRRIYSGNPPDGGVFSTKENEGPDLVEYKNRIHLEDDDAATLIVDEIKKEVNKQNGNKVFLWGFTEQNHRIEGLSTQSMPHDRLTSIEKRVKAKLDEGGLEYEDFILQPINLDGEGNKIAVTGIFF